MFLQTKIVHCKCKLQTKNMSYMLTDPKKNHALMFKVLIYLNLQIDLFINTFTLVSSVDSSVFMSYYVIFS